MPKLLSCQWRRYPIFLLLLIARLIDPEMSKKVDIDLDTVVVAGSYEGKVFGFIPRLVDSKTDEHVLHQLFVQSAHTASVKAVALYGKWLASGSADETIA